MEQLKVGGKWSILAGRGEGTFFEVGPSGPMWIFYYNNPTDEEITDMSEGHRFEIRSMVRQGVLWVFVKCGEQPWAEAPYNPHLSKDPELEKINGYTEGYLLTLILVDQADDTIRHIRAIGLGNRFSRQLYSDVKELIDAPFDEIAYDAARIAQQMAMSTDEMVKGCKNYWKI